MTNLGLQALSPLPTGALPVLRHVAGDLTVIDNGALETVGLPSLATAGGSVLVINNERLATLRLPGTAASIPALILPRPPAAVAPYACCVICSA